MLAQFWFAGLVSQEVNIARKLKVPILSKFPGTDHRVPIAYQKQRGSEGLGTLGGRYRKAGGSMSLNSNFTHCGS